MEISPRIRTALAALLGSLATLLATEAVPDAEPAPCPVAPPCEFVPVVPAGAVLDGVVAPEPAPVSVSETTAPVVATP